MARRAGGFTLLDVMVTVLIIGIMGLAALPRISDFLAHRRLRAACIQVTAGLEYAATLGVRYQRPFTFAADTTQNRFQVLDSAPFPDTDATVRTENTPPVNADDVVFNSATGTWYQVVLDEAPGLDGVRISAAPAEITFYPDGHSGETDSRVTLRLNDRSLTVTVDRISGRVSVN